MEAELLAKLDAVKEKRRSTERYSEAWAELGYEMARLSEAIRKIRWGQE